MLKVKFIFQLKKNEVSSKAIPYKQQCYTDYMYGKDDSWENLLASYESSLAIIIDKIIKNQSIMLEDEVELKNYILYQHLRTEKAIDNNHLMQERAVAQLTPILAQTQNINLTPIQAASFAKQYVRDNNARVQTASMNLEIAKRYSGSINDLRLLVLHSSNNEFVCSDNPVIMDNLFLPDYGLGFECVGIIFFMPVSTQYAIMIYDSKVYSHNKFEDHNIVELTEDETSQFNKLSFIYAWELLFSNRYDNLMSVKKYFDSKYIDKLYRDIFLMCGMRDPILIGIEIAKLKKSSKAINDANIPKFFAKRSNEKFPLLELVDEFRPFINDINANFRRNSTLQELAFKMSFWDKAYCDLVRKYLTS